MPWSKTGATQYHAQLGLQDKGRAIKGLVVCNSWDLEPWDLQNRPLRYDSYASIGKSNSIFPFRKEKRAVPFIITSCVREVERRGINEVIYF